MTLLLVVFYVFLGIIVALYVSRHAEKNGRSPFGAYIIFGGGDVLGFLIGVALWPAWIALDLFDLTEGQKQERHEKELEEGNRLLAEDRSRIEGALIGRVAFAKSALRPMGSIEIDDLRFEAKSKSGLVPPNSKVVIVAFEGGHPIVETKRSNK